MKQDHNDSIYVSVIPHAPRTYYEFTKRIMSRNIGGCQLFFILFAVLIIHVFKMAIKSIEMCLVRQGKNLNITYIERYKHI